MSQCQRHFIFYPISGLPPKPDPFQKIDLGLKCPFPGLISQTFDSWAKKCLKLRHTSEHSSQTIIIPENTFTRRTTNPAILRTCILLTKEKLFFICLTNLGAL